MQKKAPASTGASQTLLWSSVLYSHREGHTWEENRSPGSIARRIAGRSGSVVNATAWPRSKENKLCRSRAACRRAVEKQAQSNPGIDAKVRTIASVIESYLSIEGPRLSRLRPWTFTRVISNRSARSTASGGWMNARRSTSLPGCSIIPLGRVIGRSRSRNLDHPTSVQLGSGRRCLIARRQSRSRERRTQGRGAPKIMTDERSDEFRPSAARQFPSDNTKAADTSSPTPDHKRKLPTPGARFRQFLFFLWLTGCRPIEASSAAAGKMWTWKIRLLCCRNITPVVRRENAHHSA